MSDETKICGNCKEFKALNRFQYRKESQNLRGTCKDCRYKRIKKYNEKNPHLVKARSDRYRSRHKERLRAQQLRIKFNITIDAYERMFRNQNGVCAICGKFNVDGRRLAVDHDHNTGRIRGLLCRMCNVFLGLIENTPGLLHKFSEYIEKFSEKQREVHGY